MKRVTITFEDDMYDFLKELAKQHRRQTSNEVNEILSMIKNGELSTAPKGNTLEQLKEAGVSNLRLDKTKTLTPEQERLEQIKLQQKVNNLNTQREKKWFTRAREVMTDYWDDEMCRRFAHVHIYGDDLYHTYPDDPYAIKPEETDDNIEQILQQELSEYDNYDDTDDIIEPTNDLYQKLKYYCHIHCDEYEFDDIITHIKTNDISYLKECYKDTIFNALELDTDDDWDDDLWCEFAKKLLK